MRPIVTAVAAVALAAGAAHAQGNNHGNTSGKERGGGQAAGASMQGKAKGNGQGNAGRGGGPKQTARDTDRGPAKAQARVETRVDRDNSAARGNANVRVAADRRPTRVERGNVPRATVDRDRNRANERVVVDRDRNRVNNRVVVVDHDRHVRNANVVRVANYRAVPVRRVISGCPPGLAKKNPPCVPPGHVRTRVVRYDYDRPDFWGLRLADNRYRYRYDNGYLLRLEPSGRTGGYIPLLGGALAAGNPWPTYYQPVALPTYYENYYGIGPYNSYRYADNVIYRVNPETAAITSIAALLTGDDFTIGQPAPLGYDVYNVPYPYRTQYVDSPTAMYRYSDGYVYQIDPTTRLVAAAIELALS